MGEPFAEVAPGEWRVLLSVFFVTLFVVVGMVDVGTFFVARDAAWAYAIAHLLFTPPSVVAPATDDSAAVGGVRFEPGGQRFAGVARGDAHLLSDILERRQ